MPPSGPAKSVILTCFCATLLFATNTISAEQNPITVTTTPIGELLYLPLNSAPATTFSLNESRVSPQTPGFITQISVRVGDRINRGELLAKLDCTINLSLQREAEASITSARAQLTLAQRQIRRTKTLREDRNISEETLNQRETDLKTTRAEVNRMEAALKKAQYDATQCRVVAPFAGVILERLAAEGEWITPGQPLVKLMDTERLEVSVQIPLHQADSLLQAEKLELLSGGVHYQLILRHLLPIVDRRGRNREGRLEFRDEKALPGSSGRLQWRAPNAHLPADILVRRDGKLGVMLEQDSRAHFHPLPDALEGHPAVTDLPPRSYVILQGRQKLADGDNVRVSNPD